MVDPKLYSSSPTKNECESLSDEGCSVINEAQLEESPVALPNWLKYPFQSRTNAESENSQQSEDEFDAKLNEKENI